MSGASPPSQFDLNLVISLAGVTEANAAFVGAKAYSVAKLAAFGFHTPAGWCLTTSAYHAFVNMNPNVRTAIAELDRVDVENLQEVLGPTERIRQAITELRLPYALQVVIADARGTLRQDQPLAVRSSATTEDLGQSAAAGQHDTFLGVVGFDDLLMAIKRCWASLWSARAVVYRSRFGAPPELAMAVLVQEMVRPDLSGVLFTRNPLSTKSTELLVSCAPGSGEQIVSGAVPVDTLVVDRHTLAVREESLKVMRPFVEGQESVAVRSISSEQLINLSRVALEAEALFGKPLDIEWSFEGAQLFLLQARPITSGNRKPRTRPRGYLRSIGVRLLLDYFPVPLYHFDRAFVAPLVEALMGMISEFGIRAPAVSDLFVDGHDGSLDLDCRLTIPSWDAVPRLLRVPVVVWQTARVDPLVAGRNLRTRIVAEAHDMGCLPTTFLDDVTLLNVIRRSQELLVLAFESRRPFFVGAWFLTLLLTPLLWVLFGRRAPVMLSALRAALPHPAANMNAELGRLVNEMRNSASIRGVVSSCGASNEGWERLRQMPEATQFVRTAESFVEEYGCRTDLPIPLPSAHPLASDVARFFEMVANLDSAGFHTHRHVGEERAVFVRGYREALIRAKRFGVLRLDRLFRLVVRRNRALWLERDWVILTYERVVAPARISMREIGLRLFKRGILRSWIEVQHLSLEEAALSMTGAMSVEETRRIVDQRRSARNRTVQNWSRAILETASRSRTGAVLRGTPASPGVAVGPACLVLSDQDIANVPAGSILVCRATGPAWTPLFGTVSAVVTDLGGPLSHAAIVAREYGIPAVIGTGNATGAIRSNRNYSVNGDIGEVRLAATPYGSRPRMWPPSSKPDSSSSASEPEAK